MSIQMHFEQRTNLYMFDRAQRAFNYWHKQHPKPWCTEVTIGTKENTVGKEDELRLFALRCTVNLTHEEDDGWPTRWTHGKK